DLLLPSWIPRSASAFPDVSTSPAYDLMLILTVGIVGVAVSTAARALVNTSRRSAERVEALQAEVIRLQELNRQLVTRAPASAVLVASSTGRILSASARFTQTFEVGEAPGRFLLDAIAFAYPAVIRRLMLTGGEQIQGATLGGRDIVLCVRAEILGSGAS